MANIRTGNTQTERTLTGIITTAETIVHKKGGGKYTRWEQIGYTSVYKDEDGVSHAEGPYGQQLLKEQGEV